jgi:hypothetical protein
LVLDVTTKASVATAGDFFDVVIDCTGDQAAVQRDFGFVGARRALRIGQRGSSNVTFSDPEFHKREIRQSQCTARRLRGDVASDAGWACANSGTAHSYRAACAGPELFRDWLRPEAGVIKAMLEV